MPGLISKKGSNGKHQTYLLRIQTRTPLSPYPPYDYSKIRGVVRSAPENLQESLVLQSCSKPTPWTLGVQSSLPKILVTHSTAIGDSIAAIPPYSAL